MRVIDIPEFGYTSAIVTLEGDEKLLLLDADLSQDDRVDIMLGAMDRLDEADGGL